MKKNRLLMLLMLGGFVGQVWGAEDFDTNDSSVLAAEEGLEEAMGRLMAATLAEGVKDSAYIPLRIKVDRNNQKFFENRPYLTSFLNDIININQGYADGAQGLICRLKGKNFKVESQRVLDEFLKRKFSIDESLEKMFSDFFDRSSIKKSGLSDLIANALRVMINSEGKIDFEESLSALYQKSVEPALTEPEKYLMMLEKLRIDSILRMLLIGICNDFKERQSIKNVIEFVCSNDEDYELFGELKKSFNENEESSKEILKECLLEKSILDNNRNLIFITYSKPPYINDNIDAVVNELYKNIKEVFRNWFF